MVRNIIGPVSNLKNAFLWFSCFVFLKIVFFLQGERDFQKQKWTSFYFKKARIGPVFNFTAYIYIERERGQMEREGR